MSALTTGEVADNGDPWQRCASQLLSGHWFSRFWPDGVKEGAKASSFVVSDRQNDHRSDGRLLAVAAVVDLGWLLGLREFPPSVPDESERK
ncbi:hypothetical protein V6N11_046104 [Hibiscus sabdariffa]|uniref:Uncharacterized protein n=1 Tax=Hibiscus sabdariffa TaxID=183260 RepID=A0ABR2N846_9ROSI